jgi:phytoene dehydrogenase-like protein
VPSPAPDSFQGGTRKTEKAAPPSASRKIAHGETFDAVIIGCGMSGLAAGIRLAMFDQRVLIVERHNAPGGLNSFYFKDGRKFDVGLHAVTNYVPPGTKGTPLAKIFRQLRISPEDFALRPQCGSRVAFPGVDLSFANDFEAFQAAVLELFPSEKESWERLMQKMADFDVFTYEGPWISARAVLEENLREPLLREMLLCPICYYGSPEENDIAWDSFIILFNSLFREGFGRPFEGVRRILRALLARYRELGGQRMMRNGVRRIRHEGDQLTALELDDGTEVRAAKVFSSAGICETLGLLEGCGENFPEPRPGRLGFMETMRILDCQPTDLGWEDTIVFFNDQDRFVYERPGEPVDLRSGVICFPNNYQYAVDEGELAEGVYRITGLANPGFWENLPEERYREAKAEWAQRLEASARRFLPGNLGDAALEAHVVGADTFTPRTVTHFTGHPGGTVYGSPDKIKDGRSPLSNLYIIGTDQGFLGITGSILSGISIANRYGRV